MYRRQNLTTPQLHFTKTAAVVLTEVTRKISLLSAFLPHQALRTTPATRTSSSVEIPLRLPTGCSSPTLAPDSPARLRRAKSSKSYKLFSAFGGITNK